jgi:hypothetical protein
MAYWIAGVDVHKKMLAVVIADVEARESGDSNVANSALTQVSCERWPTGSSPARSRKS